MRKILFIMLLLLPIMAVSQSQDQNYIKTLVYKQATANSDVNKTHSSVTYYDGLGRPIQQIAGKAGGSGKDMVTHIEYDGFGRQTREYLPYQASSTDLSYISSADTDVVTFYNKPAFENTSNPYSEKFLENSPLNRVLKQAAPGEVWRGNADNDNDRTIKFAYLTNSNNEVKRFRAVASGSNYDISVIQDGFYAPNTLYKTITANENTFAINTNPTANIQAKLNTTEEFKDKEGKIVLKRTYNILVSRIPSFQTLDTYYIYDQYGNLTYVLPPNAVGSTTQLDLLCYQYKYDSRNRLVEKKLPGVDWEYIVYDKQDRIVAQGPKYSPFGSTNNTVKGWLINRYDAFGRLAYTGWMEATSFSTAARQTLQSQTFSVVTKTTSAVTIDNVAVNYTNVGYPTSGMKLLSVNYYDNYAFPNAAAIPGNVEGQTVVSSNKGLPTGSWVRILTKDVEKFGETTTIFYDSKGRVLRTRSVNSQLGGYTEVDNIIDFTGKPLTVITKHKRTSSSNEQEIKTTQQYTYTEQDRVLTETHAIGNLPAQPMANNTYNAIGELIQKKVGGTTSAALQHVDFSYNIRGWLKEINNVSNLRALPRNIPQDLFAFKINYTDETSKFFYDFWSPMPLYNGNIAETSWRTASDNIERKYSYRYDSLNRLTGSFYQIPNAATPLRNSYDEYLTYDLNGNITSLRRNGGLDSETDVIEIDNLAYTYTGNRLDKVVDSSMSPQGFKDVNSPLNDFTYDSFGNLTSDRNKGTPENGIQYNHLNLPIDIGIATSSYFGGLSYTYTAMGKKISKKVIKFSDNVIITTDYLHGFQYTDGILDFIPTSEGYVKNTVVDNVNNYNYVYQYKDHLGNVRLSYTKDPGTGKMQIMEENHYYPFGLKHEGYSADQQMYSRGTGTGGGGPILADPWFPPVSLIPVVNPGDVTYKYKYNGKELQDELGLNMYDYGARNYDPAIGRWMNIDPLAEVSRRWSPYTYCYNNPLVFVDPDGMLATPPTDLFNMDGKKIGTDGVDNGQKMVVTDDKEAKTISKTKGNVDLSTVKTGFALPSDTALQESLNVLDRTTNNGGKKEESSLVMNDGSVIQGEQGAEAQYGKDEYASAKLPNLPEGKTVADVEVSIHSHPTKAEVVGAQVFGGNATLPTSTDAATFAQFNTNIIVGPLGQATATNQVNTSTGKMETRINRPSNGVSIYRGSNPPVSLTSRAVEKILKQ